MGQYHQLTCPELNACISSSSVGSGAKAREQVWDPCIGGGLGLLCAAGFDAHPRDLPWAPKGSWAGRRIFMIGDYAEDGDLHANPAFANGPGEKAYYGARKDGKPSARRKSEMTSIGGALFPTFERLTNLRSSVHDAQGKRRTDAGWLDMAGPVRLDNGAWVLDTSGMESQKEIQNYTDYMGRVDPKARYCRGPIPLAGAPDSIPSVQEGTGGAALWVSLDAGEYIDPTAFGAVDLTAALQEQQVYGFVLATLFHPSPRGGGDYPNDGMLGVVGRWRGDRLVLMGPNGIKVDGKRITPDMVRAQFANITPLAQLWAEVQHDLIDTPDLAKRTPDTVDGGPALMAEAAKILAKTFGHDVVGLAGKPVSVLIHPATSVRHLDAAYTVPAHASIAIDDQRVWLDGHQRAALRALVGTAPEASFSKPNARGDMPAPIGAAYTLPLTITTHHALLALMGAAQA